MTELRRANKARHIGVLMAYVFIVFAALAFDLSGDRSLGALMLSTLSISLVAAACLLVGPWCAPAYKRTALLNWIVGAVIVLVIAPAFSSLGTEQEKAGELIFVYAVLIMAFPLSLALPLLMTVAGPTLQGHFFVEMMFAWMICVIAGGIECFSFCWLRGKVCRRKREHAS